MKRKSIVLIATAVMLMAAMVVGGTLAYFTDTDAQKNVMTTGKLDISQNEQQRDAEGALVDFVQDKALMPMVDAREDKTANPVVNGYFDPAMKNVVDKIVTVKNEAAVPADENNHNYDAYVRTILAFETNTEYAAGTDTVLRDGKKIFDDYIGTLGSFTLLERGTITVDGVEYVLAVKVYEDALAPQEVSAPSLKQVFLAPTANNEVQALFGTEYTILAVSQGTQTAGFESAEAALNAAFGDLETIDDATLISWLSAAAKE